MPYVLFNYMLLRFNYMLLQLLFLTNFTSTIILHTYYVMRSCNENHF